ncbi:putative transcription regulator [Phaeomoniella chlamydospora]|uniref:Putative transcription regulator n=1 Tax=Phaeomoniella chlamydospora TaxID=158046 RepID=A0A0G2G7Q4_PHACM|nr:putative transcription regulator [Phaeomoniella chlamydospora]
MAVSTSLTQFLFSHPSTNSKYKEATQSEFLALAGQGKLPLPQLSQWLSQDRLYAEAYLRFIGGVLSRIHLPINPPGDGRTQDTLEWRILRTLQSALDGIVRELAFFEATAKDYGIDLAATSLSDTPGDATFGPNKTTAKYIEIFDSFHGLSSASLTPAEPPQKSLISALVLLWATEKVYYDAWSYAHSQAPSSVPASSDLDGGALRKEFIPNWTSNEFVEFVEGIEVCLNDLASKEASKSGREAVETEALKVWEEVLDLEVGFWPSV